MLIVFNPRSEMAESPEYIRTSLAAAMTLDLARGLFHRNARLYCINLLLGYENGCGANCAYCGLSKARRGVHAEKSFIRVKWPAFPTEEVVGRIARFESELERVCISTVTRRRAAGDAISIARRIRSRTDLPISCLVSPTVTSRRDLELMREAGADKVGIAIDAPEEDLFDRLRGRSVGGPHRWDRYWECLSEGVEIFGRGNAGAHFIVGLGSTERATLSAIQRTRDAGGITHLFSFFPEEGSILENLSPPHVSTYRRVQLGRYLIDEGLVHIDEMTFDEKGRVRGFGIDLEPFIEKGEAFMTSGCRGRSGRVACNRPYGNERPSKEIRNFPFPPGKEDIDLAISRLWNYTTS